MGFLLDYTGKRWIFKVTFPGWEYIKGQTDRSFGRFILSSLSYRHWAHWINPHLCSVSWRMAHNCLFLWFWCPSWVWATDSTSPCPPHGSASFPEVWCLLLMEALLTSESFGLRRYCWHFGPPSRKEGAPESQLNSMIDRLGLQTMCSCVRHLPRSLGQEGIGFEVGQDWPLL